MTGAEGAKKGDEINLTVGYMPEGHMVVGYIAYLKVIDAEGDYYWASRHNGIDDMERLGMAHDMVNEFQDDLKSMRRNLDD